MFGTCSEQRFSLAARGRHGMAAIMEFLSVTQGQKRGDYTVARNKELGITVYGKDSAEARAKLRHATTTLLNHITQTRGLDYTRDYLARRGIKYRDISENA